MFSKKLEFSHQELEISLYLFNFSKKVSQVTDTQEIGFFLNLNGCVQGCYIPNFRVLASILRDISNLLLEKRRKKGRKLVRQQVSKWRDQDVELSICTKGRGRANYRCGSWRRIVVTQWDRSLVLQPLWSFKLPKFGLFSREVGQQTD